MARALETTSEPTRVAWVAFFTDECDEVEMQKTGARLVGAARFPNMGIIARSLADAIDAAVGGSGMVWKLKGCLTYHFFRWVRNRLKIAGIPDPANGALSASQKT